MTDDELAELKRLEKAAPLCVVTQLTSRRFLPKLYTAEEISQKIRVRPERLIELAEAGYMPHLRIDNGTPLFELGRVKSWVQDNLVVSCDGMPFPSLAVVMVECLDPIVMRPPPTTLANIRPLFQYRFPSKVGSAVYFLCLNYVVVYVGQSVQAAVRIGQHTDVKEFDSAYFIPVPVSDLDDVEGAFIRALKPARNHKFNGHLHAPVGGNDAEVYARFGKPGVPGAGAC